MTHVQITPHSTSFVGSDAVLLFRAITLKSSINLYIKIGMVPTRGLTITKMLTLASQITGKPYKPKDKAQAVTDLDTWIAAMEAATPVLDAKGKPI